jgi:transcriptional regulator with XRE-family HTH domain
MSNRQLNQAFGAAVRARRQELKMTQADLGDLLGCQQPQIAALEAGQANPHMTTIERILSALQMVPLVIGQEEGSTATPPFARAVEFAMKPRNRCGYFGGTVNNRAKICNRVAGHTGQHRFVFESETPPEIWD